MAEFASARLLTHVSARGASAAELAWAVHAWAMPRLSADGRLQVERAMKDAIAEIAARDLRAASLLFS